MNPLMNPLMRGQMIPAY